MYYIVEMTPQGSETFLEDFEEIVAHKNYKTGRWYSLPRHVLG
jgi:hypothetical protein